MFTYRCLPTCAFVLTCILLTTCSQQVFQHQAEQKVKGDLIELTVNQPSESDILFVIDNSGSMSANQQKVRDNSKRFIERLALSDNQFQIGVTTTQIDLTCLLDAQDGSPSDASKKWDGSCGRLLSPDASSPIIKRSDYAGNNQGLIDRFNQTIEKVGTNGSTFEQGLKAAYRAIHLDLNDVGKSNFGFVRENALLVIIFLSDEWDCSFSLNKLDLTKFVSTIDIGGLKPGESCYRFVDDLPSAQYWAENIANIKGRKSLVSAGTITSAVLNDAGDIVASECLTDSAGQPSKECSCIKNLDKEFCAYTSQKTLPNSGQSCTDDSCCTALGSQDFPRYHDFADYFQLRAKDSICKQDFSQTMIKLADISLRDCFTLNKAPVDNNENYVKVWRKLEDEEDFTEIPQVLQSVGFEGDGWFYFSDKKTTTGETVSEVCLAGSYKRLNGDTYKIFVISEASGIE